MRSLNLMVFGFLVGILNTGEALALDFPPDNFIVTTIPAGSEMTFDEKGFFVAANTKVMPIDSKGFRCSVVVDISERTRRISKFTVESVVRGACSKLSVGLHDYAACTVINVSTGKTKLPLVCEESVTVGELRTFLSEHGGVLTFSGVEEL